MIRSILVILLCLAASMTDASLAEKFLHQAYNNGRDALEAVQTSPDDARELWKASQIRYEDALACYENGQIYYNLGNTYAQLDDIPHAILNYRRAQYFLPHNRQLQANLQYVRSKRQDPFEEPEASGVLETLCFWHYDLTFHFRLWAAILLNTSFWAAALALLWRRPTWLKATAIVLLLGTLAFGGSVLTSAYSFRHAHPAVIMVPEAQPRIGDGNSYAPAFDTPIHAGTEVTILRRRGDWLEIELPNHFTGWLPATDLETL